MVFKVYADRRNIACGVSIELPEPFLVLECFLFEARPPRYLDFLNAIAISKGCNTEKSGVRFQSELDWEDEENGIFLNEHQVYLFNHEFGDLVMEISDFKEIVIAFFRTYVEAQKTNTTLDPNHLASIGDQLAKLE